MRLCASSPPETRLDTCPVVGGERRPVGLPRSNRSGHYAAWRSLDAETGGPVRGAAILVAACGGTSTHPLPRRSVAPAPAATGRAARQHRRPKRRRQSAAAGTVDLFGTARTRPKMRPPVAARSSSATGRKPRSSTRTTSVRSPRPTSPRWSGTRLLTITRRLQVRPAARRRPDPDHRQRWRDARPERRRDDRHLEAPRRPEVVRRSSPSPATTSSTRTSGSIDKDNVGVVTHGLRRHDRGSTARRTRT